MRFAGEPPSLVGDDVIDEMALVLAATPKDGCIVEVGVYQGGTLWNLARNSGGRPVYGYDTFTGIPYQGPHDQHNVGDFADTSWLEVKMAVPTAWVVKGVFPGSAIHMPPVAFAHLDCDQYQSIKDSVAYLLPRMMPGGVMWFDDYCLPSGQRAVDEIFEGRIIKTRTNKVMVLF